MTIQQGEMLEEADVIVVGGGIAGLAAAYRLKKKGKRTILLEQGFRVGGLIHTTLHDDLVIEHGPDAFITRKPWAYDLVKELELEDELIGVSSTKERIYILVNGELHPMPKGLNLLVPTDMDALAASGLISQEGKSRVLKEVDIPKRDELGDETLADFVRRRFGSELFEHLAEPLLAGVYNADAEKLSMHATFPQYPALEQKYGSLIEGMKHRPKPQNSKIPLLASFQSGMSSFPEKLAKNLENELRYNQEVVRIAYDSIHRHYIVTSKSDTYRSEKLILAIPASKIAQILDSDFSSTISFLKKVRYEGVGSISLVYDHSQIDHSLSAFGVVIPAIEHRQIDGMQWTTSKFTHRAPTDKIILRIFFGGPNTRHMLEKTEEEILKTVQQELAEILSITGKPETYFIHSWKKAYPQYDLGHTQLIENIMASLPDTLALAGNSYYGVGIPDTIRSAEYAVAKLL